jgi:hypothetical protein
MARADVCSLTRTTPDSLTDTHYPRLPIFRALGLLNSIARGSAAQDVIKVLLKYNAQ